MTDHLDKRKFKQKGFFIKEGDEKNPKGKYRDECKSGGRGFQGYWSEAHHVLPAEAIENAALESSDDDADKLRYIRDVQYITDWNINDPTNLVGLPNIISYDLYYQNKIRPKIPYDSVKKLYQHFMRFSQKARRSAVSSLQTSSPEGWPIHNPSNWGHSAYTAEVIQEIKVNVWDPISSNKKKHKVDAKTVKGEIKTWAEENYNWLENRGTGSAVLWEKRLDSGDKTDWYTPYTMYDVDNPIFG